MHRLTSVTRSKSALLLAAAALLSLALSLPSARPASAMGCGNGCALGPSTIYFTDATHKKILCVVNCNEDTCNGETSPYEVHGHTCCCL